MNPLHRTPVDPRCREHQPGDLDQTLRAFLQSEMPDPWPAFKPPAEPHNGLIRLPARRALFRSRFVLAASVLLLLLGHLTLSGMFSDYVPTAANRDPGKKEATNRHADGKLKKASAAQPLKQQ